jgi:type I restriction enzyme, S subunit
VTRDWESVPLGQVVRPTDRKEAPIAGKSYRQVGVRLWGAGAYERETIDGSQTKYPTLSRVEKDDLVVNKIWARNGSVALVTRELADAWVSNEFPTFSPLLHKVEPRWLHWITKTKWFWDACDAKSRGTSGQNRIRPDRFLEILVPLPLLEEQRRIVARVEAMAARLEEARGLKNDAVDQMRALLESKRSKVFTQLLAEKTCLFGDAVSLQRGRFSHRPRNDPRFFGGKHPWIQIGEIETSGKFIKDWSETLNDDGLAISKKFPRGTLLVSIAATIGAVGILDFDCCVPDSIVAVLPNSEFDAEFIYHYFLYIRKNLENLAPKTAQKNINVEILKQIPFPVLEKKFQQVHANQLDEFQNHFDALEKIQESSRLELTALLPSILAKAFAGEL